MGAVAAKRPPRFPSPLIELDVRIGRIRLSDRFHNEAHGVTLRLTVERVRELPVHHGVCRLNGPHRAPLLASSLADSLQLLQFLLGENQGLALLWECHAPTKA